jgi:hypothetical protein
MASSGMLHRVALVRTDASEHRIASIIRVFLRTMIRLLVTANFPSSPILITMMIEAIRSLKRRFLQQQHGVTSQKTVFFIVTVVKTSNLT